jgi:short-subunit dehydrogenase
MATTATLITGASAGIGRSMAMVFAEKGHDLVLVARREAELRTLADTLRDKYETQCSVIALDLAADGACQRLHDEITNEGIEIDVLVNNAGVLRGGAFRRSVQDDIDQMIALNIDVPTRLCRLFLDDMLSRGRGRILNVASIGAFQPVPSLAVYSATKAYILSFTEALAVELSGKPVSATVLCPGFTDTDMMRDEQGNTNIPGTLIMQPDRVARAAYAACMRGDVIEVPGVVNSIATTGAQLMPRWLLRGLSGIVVRGGRRRN